MFVLVKLSHHQEDGLIGDEWMSVVGYDIGETYICYSCSLHGFHSSLAICFGDDIRALTANQIVGEMDIRDTYADVPECGSCGEKLVSATAYRLESYSRRRQTKSHSTIVNRGRAVGGGGSIARLSLRSRPKLRNITNPITN